MKKAKVISISVTKPAENPDKDLDDFIDDVAKLCNEWQLGFDFQTRILVQDIEVI